MVAGVTAGVATGAATGDIITQKQLAVTGLKIRLKG